MRFYFDENLSAGDRCKTKTRIILLVILKRNGQQDSEITVLLIKGKWTFFDYDLCTGREVKYSNIHSRTEEGPHLIE